MQAHVPKKLRQPEVLAVAHCHYYRPACQLVIWPRWPPPVEDRQTLKAARPTMAWEALVEDEAQVALPPLLRLGGRPIDWPAKLSWVAIVRPEEAVAPRVVLPWQLLFARLSNTQLPTGSMNPEKEVEAEEAWEQEPHYSCLKVGSKVVSERWKDVMVQAPEVVLESLVLAAAR